ncbi:retrovirus-related Pol polyprotein from transposon 412 [Trichonephila clavipes]|nr:retrovirus-related Pol polyprotein from transposon 412 [Trichonephila clavipes]
MRIILKDEEPVFQPPRRLAFTERQEVNKQIEEWFNEGIIRPSSSEYESPIAMVKKKDGSSRMCIDYRKLNQKLVKDRFPLRIIEDVLDALQEAKEYSTLDLRNVFFHVDVDKDSRKYTSFIVPDGQSEFNKVPFGLSRSPGVFQRYVSKRKTSLFSGPKKEAFEELKKILSEGPILHLYKYRRKTELHTDACKQGYGAILLQEEEDGKLHPVYYMSKKTNTAVENISEDYAKKELITRIARWALQLEEFDYEIEHRAGNRMKHVDVLSRYPVMMVCNDTLTLKLKKAQEEDDNIQTLKSLLEKQESEEFLSETVYSTTNKKTGKKEGFLNPISKESIPLSTYHVDFIGPLPSKNKSYQHIFTVVDAFTIFTWLYPVKTVSAESALEKLKQQQKTFGNPIRIIPDRGSAFTSKLFNDYCDEENIQHLQIATGVPRGNGQVERIHRTLIPVLTKLSLDDSTKWYKYVDRLQKY